MNKRIRNLLLSLVLILVIIGGAVYVVKYTDLTGGSNVVIKDSGTNISDYSAVFLTNGQVYFGKLYSMGDSLDLRNIYYLQVNQQQNLQNGSTSSTNSSPNISLVKLGNELHGPNDRMLINHTQVLFTESLKSDSKVVTAINNYVAGQGQ